MGSGVTTVLLKIYDIKVIAGKFARMAGRKWNFRTVKTLSEIIFEYFMTIT